MFKTLTDRMLVSPQIDVSGVSQAAAQGVTLIINNRPDDEAPGQPSGSDIAAAAHSAGLTCVAIPVTQAGFSMPQIKAMATAIDGADGKILAFCRSGTRSTNLWALARASQGADPDELTALAARAGYDLSPLRVMLNMLAKGK